MAKGVNRFINVYINGKQVENNINSIRAAITKLTREQKKMTIGSDEYIQTTKKIKTLNGILREHKQDIGAIEKIQRTAIKNLSFFLGTIVHANTIYKTVTSFIQQFTNDYQKMSDVYADVMKYTGLTSEEVKTLNDELKKIDTRTPTEQLNVLAGEAGKLGIQGVKNIRDFVEAADIINIALGEDLGEGAVKNMGKLADMFGIKDKYGLKEGMLKVASTINTIGQSSTASEAYLLEFTNRMSGVGNQAHLTIDQLMGFGAVLDQQNQSVERSSTALSKFIVTLTTKTADIAAALKIPFDELRQLVETDMNAALLKVFETMNKAGDLIDLAPLFKDLGSEASGAVNMMTTLATQYPKIVEQQKLANDAFNAGSSALEEYGTKNNNAAAEMEKMEKRVHDARVELGASFMPVMTAAKGASATLMEGLAALTKVVVKYSEYLLALIPIVAAYGIKVAKNVILEKQKKKAMLESMAAEAMEAKTTAAATLAKEEAILAQYKLNAQILTGTRLAQAKISVARQEMIVENARTAAIKAGAVAQEALNAATKAFPWTWIITAVTAVIATVIHFTASAREAKKELKEFEHNINHSKAEINYLFQKLESATESSDEYKKVLQEINDIYPDFIKNHVDENGLLRDKKKALEEVTEATLNNLAADRLKNQTIKAQNKFLDEESEAFDKIRKKLAKAGFDYIAEDFIKEIQSGLDQELDFTNIMKNLTDKFGRNVTDIGAGNFFNPFPIYHSVKSITDAWDECNESIKKAEGNYKAFATTIKDSEEDIAQMLPGVTITAKVHVETEEEKKAREKFLEEYKKFQDRLKKFRQTEIKSTLNEYDKGYQEIIDKYQEYIDEAKKYGKAGAKDIRQLEVDRNNALLRYNRDYYAKQLDDVRKFIEDKNKILQTESDKAASETMSEYAKEINDRTAFWSQLISDLHTEMNSLQDSLDDIDAPDELTDAENTIYDMQSQIAEATKLFGEEVNKINKKYLNKANELVKSETEKQMDDIREKYQTTIDNIKEQIETLKKLDVETGTDHSSEITTLQVSLKANTDAMDAELKEAADKVKNTFDTSGDWVALAIKKIDWKNIAKDWKNNWQGLLGQLSAMTQSFANDVTSIVNNINEIQSNREQQELNEFTKIQNTKQDELQKRLDAGIISQEYYEAEVERMNNERQAKEKEVEKAQFIREQNAAVIQAIINGALAITQAFAQLGPIGGAVSAVIVGAMTAAQIAAIKSQPVPYATGGYVDRKQIIMAGEAGKEWIASNALLTDSKTAPVIEALNDYQNGNANALKVLTEMPTPAKSVSQAGANAFTNFDAAKPQQITNVYSSKNDDDIMKKLERTINALNMYMADPANHNVVLNRRIQSRYEQQEEKLRNYAKL